ncbi:glycosyltransferase [Paenibacillus sp. NPDC058071]|uniref:glycosyltransferase n=1 Tax=Paenibacillus sp. NPDC058071 TaxID=3346326 RepID=UPI0036DEB996
MKRKRNRRRSSVKRGRKPRALRRRRKRGKSRSLSARRGKGRKRGRKGKRRRLARVRRRGRFDNSPDAEALREGNKQFRTRLAPGGRILDWFREAFQLDTDAFLWEMYRQTLQREPDIEGFAAHKQRLGSGTPKIVVTAAFIDNSEAEKLYGKAPGGDADTAAHVFQQLYKANDLEFVHGAHAHLLGREPEGAKVGEYVESLRQGLPRNVFIARLLVSEEAQRLISGSGLPAAAPVDPATVASRNIGIFLCFGSKISMDGEGIGRFIVRLSEGLLSLDRGYLLHIATTDANAAETAAIFSGLTETFKGRVRIYHSDSMETINRIVPAHVWIVPYVGMALAQYLAKPTIVCLHDLVYMHFPDLYAGNQAHYQYIHGIAQKVTASAAAVVFDSEFTRNHEGLRFLSLPAHKTAVIRFAAPHEEYASFGVIGEDRFRASYNLYGPYITFPSVIRLHKNHDRLIDAFHRFRLTATGAASGLKLVFTDEIALRPRQNEIIAALNGIADPAIRSSILFLGRISSSHLPSLYKYASGTVVPTLFEGSCPFPILESLLMDTPVAYGRLEVVNEVIVDPSSFATFDPTNSIEMAEAIRLLWLQGKGAAPQQKAALGDILNRSWLFVANDYAALIDRIAAG